MLCGGDSSSTVSVWVVGGMEVEVEHLGVLCEGVRDLSGGELTHGDEG